MAMRRKGKVVLGTVLAVLLLAPMAWARLAGVGPLNPANGFPSYYVDTNGMALELPAPPLGTPIGAPQVAPTMVFDAPVAGNLYSQQIGFGTQAFYYNCTAQNLATAYGTFTFQVGLAASFANLSTPFANNGDQVVFSRLRSTLHSLRLPPGIYTLRYPYGVEMIEVDPGGTGLSITRDIPLGKKLDFTTVLNADVGPFLGQSPPPAFPGWIGDGVTVGPVTGSPIGFNTVRLEAPLAVNLDGAGHNFVETTLFTVSGHQFPGIIAATPLTVDRATYTRNASNTFIDVFATSVAGATVTAQIASATVPLSGGTGSSAGLFFARTPFATGTITIPSVISVSGQLGGASPTTVSNLLVRDLVTITQAMWHGRTQTLSIAANSSDTFVAPFLLVTDPPLLGFLSGGVLNFAPCPIPPATVTVASSAGGSATEVVQVVP